MALATPPTTQLMMPTYMETLPQTQGTMQELHLLQSKAIEQKEANATA
jgi:hypothetical protein